MAIHSAKSKAVINNGVKNLTAFTLNGTLTGEVYGADYPYNGHRVEAHGATYVIRSYREPIAWFKDGAWHVSDRKWSMTTTNHTSNVRMAIYWATGDYGLAA